MAADNTQNQSPVLVAPGLAIDDDVPANLPGSHLDKYQAIRDFFGADCSRMTVMAAKKFEVPEAEVLRALMPTWPVIELKVSEFANIMEALKPVGAVRIFVKSRAAVIEADGNLSEVKYTMTGPFFNVDGGGIDMHIFHKEIAHAFAVEKRSHMDKKDRTWSIQFYDGKGDAGFKVFLWENFPNPPQGVLDTYKSVVDRFRVDAPVLT